MNALTDRDLGAVFVCEATNELVADRLTLQLVAMSRPEKPRDVRLTATSFQSLSVAWTAGFDGGVPQYFALQLDDDTVIDLNDDRRR